jgi:tetratricopeptide (TPR) repeat protein
MRLYQQSLALKEQVGDLQGKAATLSQMGNVYMAKHQWGEAKQVVSEALAISRTLDNLSGVAFGLVYVGQIAQGQGESTQARTNYEEALDIFQRLGMPEANQVRQLLASLDAAGERRAATPEEAIVALTSHAARTDVGPADLAQACEDAAAGSGPAGSGRAGGEMPAAHAAYLRSLAAAVRAPGDETLAALSRAAAALLADQPQDAASDFAIALRQGLARFFDRQHQPGAAVAWQEPALAALRARGAGRDLQQAFSVALYNQAGYLANAGRLDEAVASLEEVVAIDRRFELADTASDQAALDAMRRRRDGLPDGLPPQEGSSGPVEASLESLPPEVQEQVRQAAAHLAAMSPEEREAALAAARQQQIEAQADQVVEAAQAARREGRVEDLLPKLQEAAAYFAEGEAPDSPYAHLARFIAAVIALLQGRPLPAVPPEYAARLAGLRRDVATDGLRPNG